MHRCYNLPHAEEAAPRLRTYKGETVKTLAIDIGAGTQDILLHDTEKQLENCVRLVLPSPGILLTRRVAETTASGADLFLRGHTVGGGALSRAVKRHLASGRRVFAQSGAALTIRNNLEDVAAMGIEVRDEPPPGFEGVTVCLDELDLSFLEGLLDAVGESLEGIGAAAVAVQDHGAYRRGESNRKTRLEHMRRRLSENSDPRALAYLAGEVPQEFPRLASAARRLSQQLDRDRLLVMDTAPAAAAGCLVDRGVSALRDGNLLLINAGNGHTLACLMAEGRVTAVLEHHTRRLEPAAFASYLEAFCAGEARDDDAFMADGHGLFYLEKPPRMKDLDLVALTGPNRELLEGTGIDVYYPSPGGDMMMTGPMGLVASLFFRLGI